MWNSPETIVILTRRKGEKVPTQYEVAIHDALQAVAVLVGRAAELLNVERGPFLERLTATEG